MFGYPLSIQIKLKEAPRIIFHFLRNFELLNASSFDFVRGICCLLYIIAIEGDIKTVVVLSRNIKCVFIKWFAQLRIRSLVDFIEQLATKLLFNGVIEFEDISVISSTELCLSSPTRLLLSTLFSVSETRGLGLSILFELLSSLVSILLE
jgi:hypothetical protein